MTPVAGHGALLDALRGVRWPARRPVHGTTSGAHVSRMVGVSPEFTEYRPYRQGDDPRRLDWKLLARTDRAYLRITNDRATLATMLIVDASASMRFPAGEEGKWEHARRLAVGLAAVAHASADPVGLLVPGAGARGALPPRTRRGTVGEIARALDLLDAGGDAPLAGAITRAGAVPRTVLISDFLGDADAMLRAARQRLSEGKEVYALHVVAREELDPPSDAILATDPERPELARALGPETRAEYLAAFESWREELARAWRGAGAVYRLCLATEPAAVAVRQIAQPPGGRDRGTP